MFVKAMISAVLLEVDVIEDPAAAGAALDPMRKRLLAELREPASAATLAARLDLPRQKVNYHLRLLEKHGLVREADSRTWGGLKERLMVATASSFIVSPDLLGERAADPERTQDRLSASYLIALGARMVKEVGGLFRKATESGQRLATLSIDTTVRFRSPQDRAAFTQELGATVAQLVARYHNAEGRDHRLVIGAHPLPTDPRENHGRQD